MPSIQRGNKIKGALFFFAIVKINGFSVDGVVPIVHKQVFTLKNTSSQLCTYRHSVIQTYPETSEQSTRTKFLSNVNELVFGLTCKQPSILSIVQWWQLHPVKSV